jgi:tetratricopeptide (TPR) repeat protein
LSLHAEGRDQAADPLARRAVAIAEQDGDRRVLGAMLNALGVVLAGEGERVRAEPVLRRSVALLEEAEGADALEVAQAANNLATVYADTRQYPLAERELARALPVYEKVLGSEHPLYAMASSNMFTILYQQHRVSEGEPYLLRALAVGEKKFPDTLKMADLRQCLAALEMSREHYKEAAKLLEQVIATQEKLLGHDHPQLALTLENYAAVERRLHHKSEAKSAHDRASFIQKSFLGDVK